MRFVRAASLVLSLCCTAAGAVTLATENYPPFNTINPADGSIGGISTEIVQELMKRAKQPYKLNPYPWPRSLSMAEDEADTCVFSSARTPGREARFRWVGPLVANQLTIFGRADHLPLATSLADLSEEVIGTKMGDANTEYLTAKHLKVDPASNDAVNAKKLMAGRYKYWATGRSLGLSIIQEQGLVGQIVPLFVYQDVDMYLACSLSTDPAMIAGWNQILNDMRRDGTVGRINARYANPLEKAGH